MSQQDLSRSELTTYACRCGMVYAATVWRWVDAEVQPERDAWARRHGPVEGSCPQCGTAAAAGPAWVSIRRGANTAALILDASQRASVADALIDHLQQVKAAATVVPAWLLQPAVQFADRPEETTARRAVQDVQPQPSAPQPTGIPTSLPNLGTIRPTRGEPSAPLVPLPDPAALFNTPFAEGAGPGEAAPDRRAERRTTPTAAPPANTTTNTDGIPQMRLDPKSLEAGIPTLIGMDAAPPPAVTVVRQDLGALVATLSADGGLVRLAVEVDDASIDKWEGAKIEVRPVHLRGRGYPLVGVRLVGKHFGQLGCIDAVVDPGHTVAADVFRALAERFAVEVRLVAPARTVTRSVVGEGLEPNAALCIEAARGQLARGEFPPAQFEPAKASLAALGVSERLKTQTETIAAGAYQHIVGGAEATRALEHLDRVSQKESLARLLEVDGLPMGEYDALRRRVLEGSLQHGLCAPRRFWRRLVASGLARDLSDYATQLARNRAAHEAEEGDLPAADALRAWQDIHELCRRKDLPIPGEVVAALGLGEGQVPQPGAGGRLPDRPAAAAGEIQAGEPRVAAPPAVQPHTPTPSPSTADDPLRDPAQRLRAATDILQGHARGNVDVVLAALEHFDTDELLAIMPDLSDLGPRAVPGLIAKLGSERREVRQAAVIVLGMSMEPTALEHLSNQLVREPTTVWLDVARALGGFGPSAIRALCQILRREAATPRESLAIDRVSRALAEIALSDAGGPAGDVGASGAAAVEALADAEDPRVSTAARRALANLKDVSTSGAQIRGEIPLMEVTDVRGFSRRAYEAIMVPELEVEAEA